MTKKNSFSLQAAPSSGLSHRTDTTVTSRSSQKKPVLQPRTCLPQFALELKKNPEMGNIPYFSGPPLAVVMARSGIYGPYFRRPNPDKWVGTVVVVVALLLLAGLL